MAEDTFEHLSVLVTEFLSAVVVFNRFHVLAYSKNWEPDRGLPHRSDGLPPVFAIDVVGVEACRGEWQVFFPVPPMVGEVRLLPLRKIAEPVQFWCRFHLEVPLIVAVVVVCHTASGATTASVLDVPDLLNTEIQETNIVRIRIYTKSGAASYTMQLSLSPKQFHLRPSTSPFPGCDHCLEAILANGFSCYRGSRFRVCRTTTSQTAETRDSTAIRQISALFPFLYLFQHRLHLFD